MIADNQNSQSKETETSTDDMPSADLFDSEDTLDWWPDLSDLDRLNVLGSPKEDRARMLAAKFSNTVDEVMTELGSKAELTYLDDFELSENPTKIIPLRLIHSFSCLPLKEQTEGRVQLIIVWPPTSRMSRWIYAVSGHKPVWSLGSPENYSGDY